MSYLRSESEINMGRVRMARRPEARRLDGQQGAHDSQPKWYPLHLFRISWAEMSGRSVLEMRWEMPEASSAKVRVRLGTTGICTVEDMPPSRWLPTPAEYVADDKGSEEDGKGGTGGAFDAAPSEPLREDERPRLKGCMSSAALPLLLTEVDLEGRFGLVRPARAERGEEGTRTPVDEAVPEVDSKSAMRLEMMPPRRFGLG